MAIRAFDYACSNGHFTEHFTSTMEEEIKCPECGLLATRQICSPQFKLEGLTGDFPGAAMKWDKKHAEQLKVEQKRNSS